MCSKSMIKSLSPRQWQHLYTFCCCKYSGLTSLTFLVSSFANAFDCCTPKVDSRFVASTFFRAISFIRAPISLILHNFLHDLYFTSRSITYTILLLVLHYERVDGKGIRRIWVTLRARWHWWQWNSTSSFPSCTVFILIIVSRSFGILISA